MDKLTGCVWAKTAHMHGFFRKKIQFVCGKCQAHATTDRGEYANNMPEKNIAVWCPHCHTWNVTEIIYG